MRPACELDLTLKLPPIGTRVALVDDNAADGAGPTGVVSGFGTITHPGAIVDPSTPLVPVVIVRLDRGTYHAGHASAVFINEITVHPDNLLTDDYGRWVETRETST